MAGPEEPGRPLRPARRNDEPRQLRRAPARPDAAERPGAGPGRGLASHRRRALRSPRRPPPARLVRGPGDAHGPAPPLRAGHPRHHHRPRPGRDRHAPPRRGRARDRGRSTVPAPSPRPSATRSVGWFREYLRWLTTRRERASRSATRRTTTPPAGSCRWPPSRIWSGDEEQMATRASGSRPSSCPARWRPTAASPRSCAAPSRTATRCSTSKPWPAWRRPSPRRTTTSGRSRRPDGRGLRQALAYLVPFIRDKKTWPKPPDVMYDERVADAAGQPPLRRPRPRPARLRRAVEDAARGLECGRGGPELLHPPTGALGRASHVRTHRQERGRHRRRLGIGEAIALLFASRARASASSTSTRRRPARVADAITARRAGRPAPWRCDVSSGAEVTAAMAAVEKAAGPHRHPGQHRGRRPHRARSRRRRKRTSTASTA